MVIHVDPEQKTGFLVSFPRDLAVKLPGSDHRRSTPRSTRPAGGGPQRVVDTLQQDFNVPIQHYIEVDFQILQGHRRCDGRCSLSIPSDAPSRGRGHSGFEFHPVQLPPWLLHPSTAPPRPGMTCWSRGLEQLRRTAGGTRIRRRPRAHSTVQPQQIHEAARGTEAFRRSGEQASSTRPRSPSPTKTIPKLKADQALNSDDIKEAHHIVPASSNPNDPNSLGDGDVPDGCPAPKTTRDSARPSTPSSPTPTRTLARLRQFGPTPVQQNGPKRLRDSCACVQRVGA